MATSFIKIDGNDWNIVKNLPEIYNIPVISSIGTSRDGKSTFLNLYTNWVMNKMKKQ